MIIYLIFYAFLLFSQKKILDSMKIEREKWLKKKKHFVAEICRIFWSSLGLFSIRFDSMLYGFVHKFGGFTVLICFIIFYVPFYNSLQDRIPNRINANKCFYEKLSENFNRISKLFFSALFVNSIFFWSGSSSHHYFQ